MKNVILTPNPYRDRNFATVRSAMQILKDAGLRVSVCLPFEVDRSFELPKDLRISRSRREKRRSLGSTKLRSTSKGRQTLTRRPASFRICIALLTVAKFRSR